MKKKNNRNKTNNNEDKKNKRTTIITRTRMRGRKIITTRKPGRTRKRTVIKTSGTRR